MPTRTVTGTIYNPDGTADSGGTVTITLMESFETSTEVYYSGKHTETLDGSGAFSTSLGVPDSGTAHYSITLPGNETHEFYLQSGAAVDLVTLITAPGSAVDVDAVQTLLDAYMIVTIVNPVTTYAVLDADEVIRCSGTFTVTLPAATGSGRVVCIKNISTGTITVDTTGGDTIDGAATYAMAAYDWIAVLDGAADKWDII